MMQLASAMGREQLKLYPQRMAEIDKAMNYFWDILEGTPGIKAHRPPKNSGTTMGGWYIPLGLYRSEELEGLSITRFCEAVTAEGFPTNSGCNAPLHLRPIFNSIDVYHQGKPTRIANSPSDIRQPLGSMPVSEGIPWKVLRAPWFKHYRPKIIEEHANAFKKVVENYKELLPGDKENSEDVGSWGLTKRR